MLIDEPARAQRLARALCADVRLYNESAVREAAPADRARVLGEPVYEAYELYVSRVTEPQRHWFEEAAMQLYAELGIPFRGIEKRVAAPARLEQVAAAHPPVPGREREAPEAGSGGSPLLAIAAAVIVTLLGALAFLLSSR